MPFYITELRYHTLDWKDYKVACIATKLLMLAKE